jgi:hypothetical protein
MRFKEFSPSTQRASKLRSSRAAIATPEPVKRERVRSSLTDLLAPTVFGTIEVTADDVRAVLDDLKTIQKRADLEHEKDLGRGRWRQTRGKEHLPPEVPR